MLKSLPASYTPARTPQDELRYTQKKIEANFSNFSAWHCRTKILGGLWADMPEDQVSGEKDNGAPKRDSPDVMLIAEYELVRQALWTDPGDQSGWLYHRWLTGTSGNTFLSQ